MVVILANSVSERFIPVPVALPRNIGVPARPTMLVEAEPLFRVPVSVRSPGRLSVRGELEVVVDRPGAPTMRACSLRNCTVPVVAPERVPTMLALVSVTEPALARASSVARRMVPVSCVTLYEPVVTVSLPTLTAPNFRSAAV